MEEAFKKGSCAALRLLRTRKIINDCVVVDFGEYFKQQKLQAKSYINSFVIMTDSLIAFV